GWGRRKASSQPSSAVACHRSGPARVQRWYELRSGMSFEAVVPGEIQPVKRAFHLRLRYATVELINFRFEFSGWCRLFLLLLFLCFEPLLESTKCLLELLNLLPHGGCVILCRRWSRCRLM